MSKELKEKVKENLKALNKSKSDLSDSYIKLLKFEYSKVKKLLSSIGNHYIRESYNSTDDGNMQYDYCLTLEEKDGSVDILDDFTHKDPDYATSFEKLSKDDLKLIEGFVKVFYDLIYDLQKNHLNVKSIIKKSGLEFIGEFDGKYD